MERKARSVAMHRNAERRKALSFILTKKKKNIPQWDDEGERQLWNAFCNGNKKSKQIREVLICRYTRQTLAIADSFFFRRMPEYSLTTRDDLRSLAVTGMIEAVDSFTPSRGVKFIIFARYRINGSMIDGLRKLQDYPRVIAKNRREIKPKIEKLRQQLHRKPTIDEICKEHGEDLREIVQDPLFASGVFNQSIQPGSCESKEYGDLSWVEDHRTRINPVDLVTLEDKVLDILDNAGRSDLGDVIYGYYYLGMTNAQIAASKGISVSTATNRHHEALAILKRKLTKKMIMELISEYDA